MNKKVFGLLLMVTILLAGCTLPKSRFTQFLDQMQPTPSQAPTEVVEAETATSPAPAEVAETTEETTATEEAAVTFTPPAPEATATQPVPVGPDQYPAGINPLSGLPVVNPDNLLLPPALVTITNWPSSARPQAGLTFSPIVFEWYIGEGMSRYQALFYGDYPENVENNGDLPGGPTVSSGPGGSPKPASASSQSDVATLGPIRSGRLPFEYVRTMYNGFLIMASAYKGVAQHLSEFTNVFGSDDGNINSAMIKVTQLEDIAYNTQKKLGNTSLSGMYFDPQAPAGGSPASRLWFMYNILNEVIWNYDAGAGVYHRYQYTADDVNTFVEDTDRINGKALGYSNLIVLFAEHRACTDTAYDVNLMYVNRAPALLFRDGQVYKMYWTTKSDDYEKKTGKMRPIRFIDEQGNPFPLKPGQTWIHVVPTGTRTWETKQSDVIDSMIDNQAKKDSAVLFDNIRYEGSGTGQWAIRFQPSLMIQDQAVCDKIRSHQ
jgi:hypothetical protein